MAADTALLDLVTPTQGDLTGTWGNVVNNGITEYVDIAIAGTTTFDGNGAVTLVNTVGNASQTNIVSTSAQYAIVRVTGTLTTPKIITFGSAGAAPYSKLYLVDNAATGSTVTFKAYNQTGVSVAVGERCFVYYNGTDIVKATSTTADGVSTISFGSTGLTPSTATDGAVTVAGVLAVANGGTNLSAGTSGGVLAYTGTGTLASSAALTANKMVIGGGAGVVPSTTTVFGTAAAVTTGTYAQAVGYADTIVALGNSGTAINIDGTGGNVFSATLTGNCTFTLRYPVATGSSSFTLILTNDATAGRTVAWAGGSFLFPGGSASLSRTTTANATDVWFFFTPNGGTTWYGSIPMKNLTA
jgi:hypothetical protein